MSFVSSMSLASQICLLRNRPLTLQNKGSLLIFDWFRDESKRGKKGSIKNRSLGNHKM